MTVTLPICRSMSVSTVITLYEQTHEDRTEARHKPAESGIPQHHLAIAHPVNHLSIDMYMVHAVAYLAATQQQEAVIRTAY